ncbi:MAG TPA: hypothetical protein VNG89_28485 [Vicinamibacterales bacterium]|nr:hypothetical protein [Vicinamibacterales bacterium]
MIVVCAAHPATPNAAWVTPPLAKQDHDTVPADVVGAATPDPGATRSAVVGALGILPELPQADNKSDVALTNTIGCKRMAPLS